MQRSKLQSSFHRRAHLACLLAAVAITVPSACVVRVSDKDSDEGSKTYGQTLDACERALEGASPETERDAFETAMAELEAGGVSPADVWSNEVLLLRFRAGAMRAAGCDLSDEAAGVVTQELHLGDGGDNYCGPGHGGYLPAVSDCLNAVCASHDACYAACSKETSLSCVWNSITSECDDKFFAAGDRCEHESHWFSSNGVLFVARAARALAPDIGCDSGMTCPGRGPCVVDRQGLGCAACLKQQDPNGVCLERACHEVGDDCYLANCPQIGGCFGGYTEVRSEPGAGGAPAGEGGMTGSGGAGNLGPATGEWVLTFVGGEVPPTKANGDPWDESPFGPPDPFIVVTFADATTHTSSSPEDTNAPDWSEDAPVSALAEMLQQPFTIEMWDEDILDHDRIGACSFTLTASDFDGGEHDLRCPSVGSAQFNVRYRLDRT